MTRHWGLEVDRVELTLGSLVKAPADDPCGSLIMPPSVPGLEGLTGPIQQLAMHFLGSSGSLQHKQGIHTHTHTHTHNCFLQDVPFMIMFLNNCGFYPSEDCLTFTDELSSTPQTVVATPVSVEELLDGVKLLLSETLVRQVGACFQFNISSEDGQHHSYYVDLSQGDGYIYFSEYATIKRTSIFR